MDYPKAEQIAGLVTAKRKKEDEMVLVGKKHSYLRTEKGKKQAVFGSDAHPRLTPYHAEVLLEVLQENLQRELGNINQQIAEM